MRASSVSLALVLAACSAPMSAVDAGTDAGDDTQEVLFDVSASAAMVPESLGLLADAGVSPSMAGLTARVEEPFRVATVGELGVFSSKTMDVSGTFGATMVSTTLVTLGVAGGIRDDVDAGTPRVIRAATVLFDVALEGKKPSGNVSGGKAWAVPTVFHDRLTAAIGAAQIQSLTSGNQKSTLIGAGFILGRLVDANGAAVSGATIKPSQTTRQGRFFYPTADYASVGTATSSTGVFVYVHNGSAVDTFSFTVDGKPEYKSRTAGAAPDACLVITVYPGSTPVP